jgi:hypothetical protein
MRSFNNLYVSPNIVRVIISEDEMREIKKAYKIVVGKHEEYRPRREDSTKMDPKETEC